MQIKEAISSETEIIIKERFVLFGYANEELKRWFLSRSKKCVMPKGCRLLFRILAYKSNIPISVKSTYPMIGDIVSDIKGDIFEIIEVEWI